LPLKGVECEFSVRGGVVEVCLSQIFRQENPKPFDCEYLFPLPADAAVYSCEADINGRIIRAEVKEREEARALAAEKKAEGFRTALVESERDNLFALGLGNVQPDDLIVVHLKYFQTLRALDEMPSVEIPFCPGVRYIPGKPLLRSNRGKGVVDDTDEVPDASRITPVRIDAGHPDAAYIDVRGKLDARFAERATLVSPSHSIEVQSSGDDLCVTLSDKGEVPDRDFVLRWNECSTESLAPRAWVRQTDKDAYALLEVRAPREISAPRTALDFYFLVDRSGSMEGLKWTKAVEALQSCVAVLGPDDRAMITLFESNFQDFAEEPLPARKLLEDRRFQKLEKLGAGGGTEMASALRHVIQIAAKKSQGREKNLILITDAQVGNESAILELMKTAPEIAMHCFGIDIALNDALLLALCRQQGGTFHSLNPNDDIQRAVTGLGKTLRQPVLLDLKLSSGWESADAKIPNLYAGQILYVSARAKSDQPLELSGRTPGSERVCLAFQREVVAGEAPRLRWCKSRTERLLAEGHDREAIALSVANNLLCRLTAFVAWDPSEKVVVSRHELVQPSMELSDRYLGCVRDVLFSPEPHDVKHAFRAPSIVARSVREESPDDVLQQLHALRGACQRLGGTDWQPAEKSIQDWFAAASGGERARWAESLKRLIQKLTICANLQQAMHNRRPAEASELLKRARLSLLDFRKMQQHGQAADGDWTDLEAVLRRAGTVDASASAGQFSLLAEETRRSAVEMVKNFAASLPAGK